MKAVMITRDRVTYARRCLASLRNANLDVTIVDHESTYHEMTSWLDGVIDDRRATVMYRENAHPRDIWKNGVLAKIVRQGEPFIVTDCDVVPDPNVCPIDWVRRLRMTLNSHPRCVKVGLGLRIDNIPDHFLQRDQVSEWESKWWQKPAFSHGVTVYEADVDTTLAMYRWLEPFNLGPAIRLGAPYVARHMPWYERSVSPSSEELYYRKHALEGVSHWIDPAAYVREEPRDDTRHSTVA